VYHPAKRIPCLRCSDEASCPDCGGVYYRRKRHVNEVILRRTAPSKSFIVKMRPPPREPPVGGTGVTGFCAGHTRRSGFRSAGRGLGLFAQPETLV